MSCARSVSPVPAPEAGWTWRPLRELLEWREFREDGARREVRGRARGGSKTCCAEGDRPDCSAFGWTLGILLLSSGRGASRLIATGKASDPCPVRSGRARCGVGPASSLLGANHPTGAGRGARSLGASCRLLSCPDTLATLGPSATSSRGASLCSEAIGSLRHRAAPVRPTGSSRARSRRESALNCLLALRRPACSRRCSRSSHCRRVCCWARPCAPRRTSATASSRRLRGLVTASSGRGRTVRIRRGGGPGCGRARLLRGAEPGGWSGWCSGIVRGVEVVRGRTAKWWSTARDGAAMCGGKGIAPSCSACRGLVGPTCNPLRAAASLLSPARCPSSCPSGLAARHTPRACANALSSAGRDGAPGWWSVAWMCKRTALSRRRSWARNGGQVLDEAMEVE